MTNKEKKSKIADILMDFQEEYSNDVINRPMLASLYAGNILFFIDSLKEEPKFKTGDRIKPVDSCLGSPRTIVDICNSWYVTDQGTLDFEFEDNWEAVEEPVSIWHDASEEPNMNSMIFYKRNGCVPDVGRFLGVIGTEGHFSWEIFKYPQSIIINNIEKWAYVDDLLNLSNIQGTIKNCEEPVSEDLEEASRNYADNEEYGDDVYFAIKAAFKVGAKWQKEKNSILPTGLGEYINELSKQFPEVSFAKLSRIAVRVAKWQKQQDQSTIELAEKY